MPARARIYVISMIALGLACCYYADWTIRYPVRFAAFLLICVLASAMKVNLPGILGTMSVSFLFILIGILDLGAGETMLIGCAGALVQCLWKPKNRIRLDQAAFSAMNIAISVFSSYRFFHLSVVERLSNGTPVALILTALVYFVLNTAGVAAAVGLAEGHSIGSVWRKSYLWSSPFYLLGASLAWIFHVLANRGSWLSSLLLLPVIYLIYRSYRLYLGHLEDEKKHVEQMASLHLRTIEALALAIDAKDHTTHEHLNRVRTYAVELGRQMGLSGPELDALRAAALLHDIGKLAVPEHIISKPGKLTPEEFEKVKIHPLVGAEILERVEFPYPVVPIVRSHHERWDGTGYPDGLKGDQIPVGARILAIVDCFDALASDRQYRRALPLNEAMREVEKLGGSSFDSAIVELLGRCYANLEKKAKSQPSPAARMSMGAKSNSALAPNATVSATAASAAGAAARPVAIRREYRFLSSIGAARQEAQMLFELTQDLGSSLRLEDTLSLVATRLKHLVPYDAIGVYLLREDCLVPEHASGEAFRSLASLRIPMGRGLSGVVARTGQPILNGNPALESEGLEKPANLEALRSALAVPLIGIGGVIGVLTVYRVAENGFAQDHLRVLLAISSKVSLVVENSLKYRQAETTATTDYLTSLPNARSLFLRLDSELARARRRGESLSVLVCDLDGFKQVNDRFGHVAGNQVLRAVAAALQESCREYDYVARMGGDEFVLILPEMLPDSMQIRIAELRRVAAAAGQSITREEIVTMSVGTSFFPRDGEDAEQLLAAADRQMYQEKQAFKKSRLGPERELAGAASAT
ncbi:MAG TPA: HD domain-containing phosphohydrolase, partial [Bryobacteraceae bacterium]|nr:HD domain-containing phosphohydrolase [Bryobacteraceae bacterium]